MSSSGSRALNRGKNWERTVAKAFSMWITHGETDAAIVRQSMMGRMVERIIGDLAASPDVTDKWRASAQWFASSIMVDAKNDINFSMRNIIGKSGTAMLAWWKKLSDNASRSGRRPLLVPLDGQSNERYIVLCHGMAEDSIHGWPNSVSDYIVLRIRGTDPLVILRLDDFINVADPNRLGCPQA